MDLAGQWDHRPNPRTDRVLVIDDFEVARIQLRRLLEAAGFYVVEQPSAIGATRTILVEKIEAVVVDVTMPGLSGDRLVELLRRNPRLQGLVIVIVSARSVVPRSASSTRTLILLPGLIWSRARFWLMGTDSNRLTASIRLSTDCSPKNTPVAPVAVLSSRRSVSCVA